MRTIGPEELKQMLDRQDPFRLVMALGEWGLSHQALMTNIELYGTQVVPRVRELLV